MVNGQAIMDERKIDSRRIISRQAEWKWISANDFLNNRFLPLTFHFFTWLKYISLESLPPHHYLNLLRFQETEYRFLHVQCAYHGRSVTPCSHYPFLLPLAGHIPRFPSIMKCTFSSSTLKGFPFRSRVLFISFQATSFS
jgi:hypothetical protein